MSDEMKLGNVQFGTAGGSFPPPAPPKPPKRVAVRVLHDQHGNVRGALANDGSIWYRSTEGKWTRLPDLPQE